MSTESTLHQTKIRHLDLNNILTVDSTYSLGETIKIMQSQRSGCILITGGSDLLGIFTERDLLQKVAGKDEELLNQPIQKFMTIQPTVLSPDSSLLDAITLMYKGGYRHIPLIDSEKKLHYCLSVTNIIDYLSEQYPQELLSLPPRPEQNFTEPDGA